MEISICSYSFHRLLQEGKQDIFKYITDCQALGATQLEPWNGHFQAPGSERGQPPLLANAAHAEYVAKIKAAGVAAGMPFGCIAVDGAHIYEADSETREANRTRAYQWLDVAAALGARQIRIDAGGPEAMPDNVFQVIVAGYQDLVAKGRAQGVEIVMENHWGPSMIPENVVKIMEAIDGLGLLFDTGNWAAGMQEKGWQMCARYATASHIKTFEFDADGNELTADVPKAIKLLLDTGYHGCWGIESTPTDGQEYEGARKTIALIKRILTNEGFV